MLPAVGILETKNQIKQRIIMITKYQSSRESTVYKKEPIIQERKGLFETKLDGFDINITFGANLDSGMTLRWNDNEEYTGNPMLSHAYGYGYRTKTTKTPGKLITEKVRNTINNKSTKDVAKSTKSEAASKSVNWDTDAIEEFQCEFAYDYWRVAAPSTTGVLTV
jgi:hypothetical protein